MNTTNANAGGWESSYMRNKIMPEFIAAMPQEWQNVMYECTKYTDNVGGGSGIVASNVTATKDKLFLPSLFEMNFADNSVNTYELGYQQSYSYYQSVSALSRGRSNATTTSCSWWLRSPATNSQRFSFLNDSGGNNANPTYSLGIAPIFVIA